MSRHGALPFLGGTRPITRAVVTAALLAAGAAAALSAYSAVDSASAASGPTWPVLAVDGSGGALVDIGPSWSTTISLPTTATSVAVAPDARYAYTADYYGNTVSVIANPDSPQARLVANLTVGSAPCDVKITPDGKYAYVANFGSNTVSVIDNADSASPTVSASVLHVGSGPCNMGITPDGQYVYVSNYSAGTLSVIDNADSVSPSVSASVLNVGGEPDDVAMTPDGKYAYVPNNAGTTVSVIDNPDSANPSVSASTLTVGSKPSGDAVTPDGQYVYVALYGANAVAVIDNADSGSPSVSASTLAVGSAPIDAEMSPDGNSVYVSNSGTTTMSVITGADSASPTVSGTLSAGFGQWYAAVVPDQAPAAQLTVTPGQPGSPTSFSAASSTVAFGTITSYAWNFGDGDQVMTSTPTTTHTYASGGTYTVTVTETDSDGTSTTKLAEGTAVLRNGGPAALASASLALGAAACSASGGAPGCALSTSLAVGGGTLSLEATPQLYWDEVLSGYDQWETGSASALSGCSPSGNSTSCSGGSAPSMQIVDATGSGAGWAIDEYLSTSDLPAGTVIDFNGSGGTPGVSTVSKLTVIPYSAVAPQAVCDYGSSCTAPSDLVTNPPSLTAGTGVSSQVALYWAWTGSGMGAICLASTVPSGTGCAGATEDADFDLALPANARAGTDATTVVNLTVSSGP